jgi:hypothetical protein
MMNECKMLRWGLVLSAAVYGCGGGSNSDDQLSADASSGPPPAEDAGAREASPPPPDSGKPADAGAEGSTLATASVRVAHLSPDAPAVDLCVAPHGTSTFTGPVLAGAGSKAGLAYSEVTKYLPVPAVQLDVRLVAPDSSDCSTSLAGLPDFTDLPTLPAGAFVTIAAEGSVAMGAATPFGLHPYIDDSIVPSGSAALRFIHASPGTPPVDVGLGGGILFTPIFSNVAFGDFASTGTDADGYLVSPPIAMAEVSARAHGTSADVLEINPVSLPAGAIATAFAIGEVTSTMTPLKVLLCVDNAAPTGLLAACSVVGSAPRLASIRIAHLSPDAPAVDACVAPTGTGSFAGPLLHALGAGSGLSYPQVTVYVDLPAAAYDLRVVAATATDCGAPAIPDTKDVTVTNGLTATVAAIGDFTPAGTDPAIHLAVFVDDTTAPSGDAAMRFIHASPGTPAVDVGLGATSSTFSAVFSDVAFGTTAAASPAIPVDAQGFYTGTFSDKAVSARVHGTKSIALSVASVSLVPSNIVSAFAIGGKTGDKENPLSVLLCADNGTPSGLLTPCTVN